VLRAMERSETAPALGQRPKDRLHPMGRSSSLVQQPHHLQLAYTKQMLDVPPDTFIHSPHSHPLPPPTLSPSRQHPQPCSRPRSPGVTLAALGARWAARGPLQVSAHTLHTAAHPETPHKPNPVLAASRPPPQTTPLTNLPIITCIIRHPLEASDPTLHALVPTPFTPQVNAALIVRSDRRIKMPQR
jgi:hypothetical protein